MQVTYANPLKTIKNTLYCQFSIQP